MLKFLAEFSPLIAFFIGYKTGGILDATLYILVASIISSIIMYIIERKINNINLISTLLVIFSASLTLISGNPVFIKIKATIFYFLLSMIFLITSYKYKPAVRYMLEKAISMQDEQQWVKLNMRFMWFFLMMAAINEIVWRNFSESAWVNFKFFGATPMMVIFLLIQIPFLLKNKTSDMI